LPVARYGAHNIYYACMWITDGCIVIHHARAFI
jgi:hypothetical protein